MTTVFISDLHLDEQRPDITRAFLDFLNSKQVKTADALYILGDFFEVWLGDDDSNDLTRSVISALSQLALPTCIMHGNRDFLIGEQFCTAAGVKLLSDPCICEVEGETVLLMHGDSLCTRDEAYMQVRQLLRSPAFQEDFLAKTIPERQAFAQSARAQSKDHTRETAMDIMDVTPEEVINSMNEHQVSTLIHGHTHRPKIHSVPPVEGQDHNRKRIVLGDWDKKGWYLLANQGEFELIDFNLK